MKPISTCRIAAAYAGCVLGAGFVSGQELWQFFGTHGAMGIVGMLLCVALFFLAGVLILGFAHDTKIAAADALIVGDRAPLLRGALVVVGGLFLFVIYVLMAAAAGSLLAQVLGLPTAWGSAVLCVAVTLFSLSGVRGLVRVFAWLVPALVVATLVLSVLVLCAGTPDLAPDLAASSPMRPWWLDALIYVNFNIICSIPILAPLGKHAADAKAVRRGVLIASFTLGALAVGMLAALSTDHTLCHSTALPMLELARSHSRIAGGLYAILLFGGIFGTALSAQSSLNEYLLERVPRTRRALLPITAGASVLAFLAAQFGFRDLVGVLYPLFGYLGIIPLVILAWRAVCFYRKRKKELR